MMINRISIDNIYFSSFSVYIIYIHILYAISWDYTHIPLDSYVSYVSWFFAISIQAMSRTWETSFASSWRRSEKLGNLRTLGVSAPRGPRGPKNPKYGPWRILGESQIPHGGWLLPWRRGRCSVAASEVVADSRSQAVRSCQEVQV